MSETQANDESLHTEVEIKPALDEKALLAIGRPLTQEETDKLYGEIQKVVSKYRDYEFSDRKFSDRKSSDFQRIFFSVTENLVTTSMVSNMSERNFSD